MKLPGFKTRLKHVIKSSNLSISKFCQLVQVSRGTLHTYLNGKRVPRINSLYNICYYSNTSMDWLLGLTDKRNKR